MKKHNPYLNPIERGAFLQLQDDFTDLNHKYCLLEQEFEKHKIEHRCINIEQTKKEHKKDFVMLTVSIG